MADDTVVLFFREGPPTDLPRATAVLAQVSIAAADAMRALRMGHGFLDLRVRAEQLHRAAAVLNAAGLACSVVPLSKRIAAPHARQVMRIELTPDELRLRDPGGPALPWGEIGFVHLAQVRPKNLELGIPRDEAEAQRIRLGSNPLATASAVMIHRRIEAKQAESQKANAAARDAGNTAQTWLELINRERRLRIRLEAFIFDCLSPPLAPIARQNLARLVGEIVRRAPQAQLTPLAAEVAAGKPLGPSGAVVDEPMHDRYVSYLLTRAYAAT